MKAPREIVFDVISAPYLGRTPRATAAKLDVLERGSDMVLAAHYTRVAGPLVTTTVETVRFSEPERVDFFLVRGPVPRVQETFMLHPTGTGTRLDYEGQLSADLWALGRWWGEKVAAKWETTVADSLASIRDESERRAGHRGPTP